MKKMKQTFIWAWAADGCIYLNTENSLMGIVQDVMESMGPLLEDIEISEMDGHIQISYMKNGESRNYRIENDCGEIEVFLQEFCSEMFNGYAFSIMELVDSNDDSTYDDEPDEAEIASIERHYELYETEGA